MRNHIGNRRGACRFQAAGAILLLAILAGCGDVLSLKQENTNQVTADAAYTPANAQLVVNGAIADFECAYTRYVLGSALLGDELINAFANSNSYEYDNRNLRPVSPYAGGCD